METVNWCSRPSVCNTINVIDDEGLLAGPINQNTIFFGLVYILLLLDKKSIKPVDGCLELLALFLGCISYIYQRDLSYNI